MNGIDKITARIQAEADAENAKALDGAEQEAAAALEEYKRAADAEYASLMADAEASAASQKEQLISAARLEVNKQLLAQKQELLAEAFDKAAAELRAMPTEQYLSLLTKLAVAASRTGREEIILNAADRAAYGEQTVAGANAALTAAGREAQLTLSADTYDMDGGLVLKDGRIEVNCSLASLIENRREELSVEVARILFR